jgi:1-aminocyclopropane-1-carboxylate synthase
LTRKGSTTSRAGEYKCPDNILFKALTNIDYRNAGFFVYVDLSPYLPIDGGMTRRQMEFFLAQKFVDAGVFLHPGEEHSKYLGWFRLVFSQEEETLKEGLRR